MIRRLPADYGAEITENAPMGPSTYAKRKLWTS